MRFGNLVLYDVPKFPVQNLPYFPSGFAFESAAIGNSENFSENLLIDYQQFVKFWATSTKKRRKKEEERRRRRGREGEG